MKISPKMFPNKTVNVGESAHYLYFLFSTILVNILSQERSLSQEFSET